MSIDPRLNQIDDCLYRVAARALIVQDNKLLIVKEADDNWWAVPGGGIGHGETIEATLLREIEEELGVPPRAISYIHQIAYYNLGTVVNGVPRMNLFFKVVVSKDSLKKTSHIKDWKWCSQAELMTASLHPSYDKNELVKVM